jgi:protein SCO1
LSFHKKLPISILKYLAIILIIPCGFLFSQDNHVEIGIDEKLGKYLPLETLFTNSIGDEVTLNSVIDKPVLLAFVYYECPGICTNTLTELAWVIDRVDLVPGKDFSVLTISIDNDETAEIAAIAKENYLTSLQRDFPVDSWEFLVGDSASVSKITDAAGYYFKRYGDEYRHPGGLITISPEGKISRYIFGSQFNQFDVKMALLDAQAGKTSPTVAKMLQFCFSYDPEGQSYTLNITRIIGSIMLLGVLVLFLVIAFKKKKTNLVKN